jgi:hypothetical protein
MRWKIKKQLENCCRLLERRAIITHRFAGQIMQSDPSLAYYTDLKSQVGRQMQKLMEVAQESVTTVIGRL